jgi:hypothetical protein
MLRKFSRFQNYALRAMQRFALFVVVVLILGISSNYTIGTIGRTAAKIG